MISSLIAYLIYLDETGTPTTTPTSNNIIGLVSSLDDNNSAKSQTINLVMDYHYHSNTTPPQMALGENMQKFDVKYQTLNYMALNTDAKNHHSNIAAPTSNIISDNVQNDTRYHDLTSSATSNNTTNSSSNFETFDPANNSRSNSSQTNLSRISATGFNSLPTHSRQGSADSEQNNNAR